jgi:putative sigma-54 modulation protein
MDVTFTFRHVEPSDAVREYAREKVAKMQKYLRAPLKAEIVLSLERHFQNVEAIVHGDGHHFVANHQSENMYESIDLVFDKIDRQIREDKESATDRRKHSGGIAQMSGKTDK